MKRLFLTLAMLACAGSGLIGGPPRQLDKANVLPLAIDDAFQFRKTKIFLNEPELFRPTVDPMIAFQRQRVNFKAVTQYDRQQRYGHYYTFFWKAGRKADVTVRFEYRQQQLGSYVQAKELLYPAVKGSVKSEFQVIGDAYNEDGKVTAWRALLVENGRIVGLTQSFLWN
ncbi:MAG TPA: hypothetical protein VGO90_16720 [Chthoniobacteraceae bacterium]|jgi:hypothetical protein|nr:hypothetical protein [Chthoniobacteraceae bacterium]